MGYTTNFLIEPITIVLTKPVNLLKLAMHSRYMILGLDQWDKDLVNRKTNDVFNEYLIINSTAIKRRMVIEKGEDGDDAIFVSGKQLKHFDDNGILIGVGGQHLQRYEAQVRISLCITGIKMKDNDIHLICNIHQVRMTKNTPLEPEQCIL